MLDSMKHERQRRVDPLPQDERIRQTRASVLLGQQFQSPHAVIAWTAKDHAGRSLLLTAELVDFSRIVAGSAILGSVLFTLALLAALFLDCWTNTSVVCTSRQHRFMHTNGPVFPAPLKTSCFVFLRIATLL